MADRKLLKEEEIRKYMLGVKKLPIISNPHTTPEEQLMIYGTIDRNVNQAFGKKVLAPAVYRLVYEMKKDVCFTFGAWGLKGRDAFQSHPRFADAKIYKAHLNATKKFNQLGIDDEELARQIVITYSLFSDQVKYSYYEDLLWERSRSEFCAIVASVGFPIGKKLQQLKAKEGLTDLIKRVDTIVLMLEFEKITHSIPVSQVNKKAQAFLLRSRDKKCPITWAEGL
jgi:hypothetical protein